MEGEKKEYFMGKMNNWQNIFKKFAALFLIPKYVPGGKDGHIRENHKMTTVVVSIQIKQY